MHLQIFKEKNLKYWLITKMASNLLLKQSSIFVYVLLFTYTAMLFIHTMQNAYTYTPLTFTAMKYNARRNLEIIKSSHFWVDTSVIRKDCPSCLIIDSNPLTLYCYCGCFLPFPSLPFPFIFPSLPSPSPSPFLSSPHKYL